VCQEVYVEGQQQDLQLCMRHSYTSSSC
jgi:hypothetical protein